MGRANGIHPSQRSWADKEFEKRRSKANEKQGTQGNCHRRTKKETSRSQSAGEGEKGGIKGEFAEKAGSREGRMHALA